MITNFSINVTPNDTEEITEDIKVKFINRNKNSSKCVDKQTGECLTPSTVPEIFATKNKTKSYTKKEKSISGKTGNLLNLQGNKGLSLDSISGKCKSGPNPKKGSSVKNRATNSTGTGKNNNIILKLDNKENFEKIIEQCMKNGKDFDEAYNIMKENKFIEEIETKEHKFKSENLTKTTDETKKNKADKLNKSAEYEFFTDKTQVGSYDEHEQEHEHGNELGNENGQHANMIFNKLSSSTNTDCLSSPKMMVRIDRIVKLDNDEDNNHNSSFSSENSN